MDCITAEKKIHLYIERQLDGEELEEFLYHIEHCPSCSEELEVNFSICSALKQLNDQDEDSFDMKAMLDRDIQAAKAHLKEEDDRQFLERLGKFCLVILLILLLGFTLESRFVGGFHNSTIYRLIVPEPVFLAAETETETEETEVETNHKKEIIVKTPETEEKQTPGLIPDEL